MKKIFNRFLSAVVCGAMLLSTAVTVCASETVTLDVNSPTVINAGDYLDCGDNWSLANSGEENQHLKVKDTAKSSATLTIPVTASEATKFKISVDTFSWSANNGGGAKLEISIDGGDFKEFWWKNGASGCTGTSLGQGIVENYGALYSLILEYNEKQFFDENEHTVAFRTSFYGGGTVNQATLGNITFTPISDVTLDSEEPTVLNAGDYLETSTNWLVAKKGTANQHLRVNNNKNSAEINIPFKVAAEQKFRLTVDTLSHSVHDAISNLHFKIDDGETITINNSNCSNGGVGLAANYGVDSGIRIYNTPFTLSEGKHTITFTVNDTPNSNNLHSGTVGNVTFTPILPVSEIYAPKNDVVLKVGEAGTVSLTENNGFTLAEDDVYSYSFTSSDDNILEVSGFGEIKGLRSGKAELTAKIKPYEDSEEITVRLPVWVVRENGAYVKTAALSGNKLNVTLAGNTGNDVYVLAGVRDGKRLSSFKEVHFVSASELSGGIAFTNIEADDELVIFVTDKAYNHLYGKTVIKRTE